MITTIQTPLMGVNFRPADVREIVKDQENFESCELTLERDGENEYDSNAVRILADGEFVGFVAKEFAPEIAEIMDTDGYSSIDIRVIGWNGSIKPLLEITIEHDSALADAENVDESNWGDAE